MRKVFKRWRFLVILMMIILAFWIFQSGYDYKEDPFHPDKIVIPNINDAYEVSLVTANEWQAESQLTEIFIAITPDDNYLSYRFEYEDQWIQIELIRILGEYQKEISTGEYKTERGLQSMKLENIPTSVEDVYETAYMAILPELEQQRLLVQYVYIRLIDTRWSVSFYLNLIDNFSVQIDPYTGTIVDVRGF